MPTPAVAQSLLWRAGDPARVTVRVVDADGVPVSLAGSTWTAQVRQDRERDVLATMTTDASNVDGGEVAFSLTGVQTRAIRDAGGSSPHIDVEGSAHGTLVAFRAVIERDVTRVPDGEGGIAEPTGGLGDVLDLLLTGTTVEVVAQSVVAFGTDDQTAAEVPFTPAGSIEATDVQAAIVELDTDLVTEAATRAAADSALSDSLTAEQVVRADADAALDGRVDALEAVDPLVTGDIGTTVQAHSPVLDATTASFTLADETKLDGIAEGAEVNAVDSVDGRTGAVSLTDLYDAAGSAAAAEAAANTYTDTAVDNATSRVVVAAPTGVAATDSAAIQAAIAGSSSGDTIEFQRGTYLVNETVKLRGGRRYVGQGAATAATSVIKAADGANLDAVVASNGWATNATSADAPIVVEHMAINGNKANQTGGAGIGLAVMSYYSRVENVYVTNAYGNGIVIADVNSAGGAITGTCVENRVVDCTIYQPGGRGIYVQDTAGSGRCTDGYLSGCVVATPTGTGIYVQRAAGWFIRDNHVYACKGHGIDLRNCWATFVTNNEVDGFGDTVGGTQIGLTMELIEGRPTVAVGNLIAANEGNNTTGAFVYLRAANTSGVTTNITLAGNVATKDGTGSAAGSTGLSLQASTGTINVTETATRINGPATKRSTGGTINYQTPSLIVKAVDEHVNNSTALQNDDTFVVPLLANETKLFTFHLWVVTQSDTPGLKAALTIPAGATMRLGGVGPRVGTADFITETKYANTSGGTVELGIKAAASLVVLHAYVTNGATAGVVQLQWAQRVAAAVNTTVGAGSWVRSEAS